MFARVWEDAKRHKGLILQPKNLTRLQETNISSQGHLLLLNTISSAG